MISSVRGTVLAAAGSTVVVEIGGIGLSVTVTPDHALALRPGSEAVLRTVLIVREDDLSLFGFRDDAELAVFDLLRGVTGVGPKSAMGVLAVMEPAAVAAAVGGEDDGAFRRVSGIGPKTAKLIVVSLAGKVQGFQTPVPAARRQPATSVTDSVLVALVGLGWSEKIASTAVDDAVAAATEQERAAVPTLLRLALARLGPQGVR